MQNVSGEGCNRGFHLSSTQQVKPDLKQPQTAAQKILDDIDFRRLEALSGGEGAAAQAGETMLPTGAHLLFIRTSAYTSQVPGRSSRTMVAKLAARWRHPRRPCRCTPPPLAVAAIDAAAPLPLPPHSRAAGCTHHLRMRVR